MGQNTLKSRQNRRLLLSRDVGRSGPGGDRLGYVNAGRGWISYTKSDSSLLADAAREQPGRRR